MADTPEGRVAKLMAERRSLLYKVQWTDAGITENLTQIILEAEERGRLEEREACAEIALYTRKVYYEQRREESDSTESPQEHACRRIESQVRARTTDLPPKELGAEESGGV